MRAPPLETRAPRTEPAIPGRAQCGVGKLQSNRHKCNRGYTRCIFAAVATEQWVLLSYRLPREPSTPRIALWRRLRGLGVAKLGDGLVALPLDARTREQFEWIADEIEQGAGEASIWIASPGSAQQERALVAAMRETIGDEYRELIELAAAAESAPTKRELAKLRRHLRKVKRRDYFPPPEREQAEVAVGNVAAALQKVLA